ncbi:MAG: transcriptional regulator [Halothiobacillaceae bacterium]|nr:transcriptional regulator [Halothiobacillaceae bacterium]
MNALAEGVQISRDAGGHPVFAVLPFAQYLALVAGKSKAEPTVPHAVVSAVVDGATVIAAWREHLRLTQAEVAAAMGLALEQLAW